MFQFRQIKCSKVLWKEKKTVEKKWPYITDQINPAKFGSRSNVIDTKDIPSYFSKGEKPVLPEYNFIKKDKIKEVVDGFKESVRNYYYIMPDGNVSRLARDKKKLST